MGGDIQCAKRLQIRRSGGLIDAIAQAEAGAPSAGSTADEPSTNG